GSLAAVADWVVEREGGPVLVLEGPQAEWGGRVVAAMEHPEAAIRVGSWHLLRTAALLARCRAFVCNDTGLLHLAAAVGTPSVGVFGPTVARLYLPPGAHTAAVEPPEPSCPHRRTTSLFPPECWSRGYCLVDERSCVRHARVDDVRVALARLLGAPSGAPDRPGPGEDPAYAPRSSGPAHADHPDHDARPRACGYGRCRGRLAARPPTRTRCPRTGSWTWRSWSVPNSGASWSGWTASWRRIRSPICTRGSVGSIRGPWSGRRCA